MDQHNFYMDYYNNYLNEDKYSNFDNNRDNEDVVSMGAWVGIFILLVIPFVNIITIFVLAFGSNNQNLKNFGKAILLIVGILLIFSLLAGACNNL